MKNWVFFLNVISNCCMPIFSAIPIVFIPAKIRSEFFLRILKYRQRFKGHGKFTTWMYYIARNVFLDHLMTKAVSLSDPESLHDELSDGTTGETHYLQKELKQIVSYGLRHNTTGITRSTTLPGGYYGKT